MENKVPKRIPPKPGIAEAIHPEIGNGVSWETDQHNYLLRSPDPGKDLDLKLLDSETNLAITPDSEEIEVVTERADYVSARIQIKEPIALTGDGIPERPDESFIKEVDSTSPIATKGKEKSDRKKKTKTQDSDQTDGKGTVFNSEAEEDRPKTPKAGKLVRKAAKSIRRQEENENKAIASDLTLTESTLSPYTQWLKGLRGSEYVHPYDDDFAFTQGTGPAKEGISETFAELLASQGYKEQAVEMYLKLIEKYPEKSGFFAAKIEALQ